MRQVGRLPELYEDARSEKCKISKYLSVLSVPLGLTYTVPCILWPPAFVPATCIILPIFSHTNVQSTKMSAFKTHLGLLPLLFTAWVSKVLFVFAVALRPNAGHSLLILEVPRSHTTTHHSR